MKIEEIEMLVAMLQPQADEDTINFVIREILVASSKVHDLQPKKEIKPPKEKERAAHSLFSEWNPNDPRYW